MTLSTLEILALVLTGLVAGSLGGLLGIGGSTIMIPAMSILFATRGRYDQHLAQAAAMCVNLIIALPAARQHARKGNVRPDMVRWMAPAALACIVAGVLVSNIFDGRTLARLFAVFLLYVVLTNIIKIVRKAPDHEPDDHLVTPPRALFCGGVMGSFAGLIGIGGGGIGVPLTHVVCRVPLRQAIGASSAVMCITAGIGAAVKLATLHTHDQPWTKAIILALILAPSALLGASFGSRLTTILPLVWVRTVFTIVIAIAALRMADIL
ncbi:MAG: sulfite exporter TauE/SafE family protein [Planctomycetota bacterium]